MPVLPPAPTPPFNFDPERLANRIKQLDPRWELKKMQGCTYKFSFPSCDAEISLADLLGAELWLVQAVRRQASAEARWVDVEKVDLQEQIERARILQAGRGDSAAARSLIYTLEQSVWRIDATRKLLMAFYHLAGDIQKLAVVKERAV